MKERIVEGSTVDISKEDLEKEKEVLVKKLVKLQDKLEKYNEQSYVLTCEIEKINLMLKGREKDGRVVQ